MAIGTRAVTIKNAVNRTLKRVRKIEKLIFGTNGLRAKFTFDFCLPATDAF
ncbi:MAG: hypothetical protein BroJett011_25330 [Chloroflexota bacterium]|nr:MAG: hypothetical protein BroJett011_25330 [Chloroflexota bacterium]